MMTKKAINARYAINFINAQANLIFMLRQFTKRNSLIIVPYAKKGSFLSKNWQNIWVNITILRSLLSVWYAELNSLNILIIMFINCVTKGSSDLNAQFAKDSSIKILKWLSIWEFTATKGHISAKSAVLHLYKKEILTLIWCGTKLITYLNVWIVTTNLKHWANYKHTEKLITEIKCLLNVSFAVELSSQRLINIDMSKNFIKRT
jgi:hypothetical protein